MSPEPPLLVACLCAAWCAVCRDYRTSFDALRARADPAGLRLVWVDIEDEAERLGELEVETFPTVLIARGAEPFFLGPLTPQPPVLERLIERALAGRLTALPAASLAARLAASLVDPGHAVDADRSRG